MKLQGQVACLIHIINIFSPSWPLIQLYQSLPKKEIPQPQFLHPYIIVIPKPGKDPAPMANYRQITLINSNYNIFTKIQATILFSLLARLINRDKDGFVLTCSQAGDNTRQTIDLIDTVSNTPAHTLLLSLDIQKAFDRLG